MFIIFPFVIHFEMNSGFKNLSGSKETLNRLHNLIASFSFIDGIIIKAPSSYLSNCNTVPALSCMILVRTEIF